MKSKILLAALGASSLAACSTMHVNTTAAPNAAQTAARYHTYAWEPAPAKQADESHKNPFVGEKIKEAADAQLGAKGYRKVDPSASPDFLVGWHATSQEKTRVEDVNPYWGYGWGPAFGPPVGWGGAAGPGVNVTQYEQGTLILDVVDAASNQLVWRGDAKADLGNNPSSGKEQKKIDEAVKKILSSFPPKA